MGNDSGQKLWAEDSHRGAPWDGSPSGLPRWEAVLQSREDLWLENQRVWSAKLSWATVVGVTRTSATTFPSPRGPAYETRMMLSAGQGGMGLNET